MGKREELRDIITDMRHHGFTQLRRTTHGWLYGFQSFRLSIPHDLKDDHRASGVSLMRQEWDKLKSQVLGENPGLAALVSSRRRNHRGPIVPVGEIEPIVNIEDIVAAGAPLTEAVHVVEPDPPHHMDVPTINPFASGSPVEETTTMPSFQCEKCDRKFLRAAALGRHRTATHGLAHADKRRQHETRPSRSKKIETAKPTIVKPVDHGRIFFDFQNAVQAMTDSLKALVVERDHYKTERDELAGRLSKFEALRGLFK